MKRESDWPSDYPHFGPLIGAAKDAMLRPNVTEQEVVDIAFCWMLAEESEVMADFAVDHLDQCLAVVERVAISEYADARWQAYTVFPHAGPRAEPALRRGLLDPDTYSRRRAYLALAELKPHDARELAEHLSRDEDPYMRLAAFVLAQASGDTIFQNELRTSLRDDSDLFVREKARE